MTANDESKGFADLFAEYGQPASASARVGDEVEGRVVKIGQSSVFVDLGAKAEGIIDRGELMGDDGELTVTVGDTVRARVASKAGGSITLRTRLGTGPNAASELEQAKALGIPVSGTVAAVNKGGVEVDVAGVRAFCPISQLDLRFVEDPASYVGKKFDFRVTRYDEERGKPNVVLSRRSLLEEENVKRSAELRAKLEVGSTVSGTVSTLKEYGAFIDLGGIEGLLHVSELGYERVKHPSELLEVGQTVTVRVTKLDLSSDGSGRDRISLSLKALAEDPFEQAIEGMKEGQQLHGTVVRTEPFGAFVKLEVGVEGLVHVSELGSDRRVQHAREVVNAGTEVDVVVLGIDRERRRVSLSIKAVGAKQEADQARDYKGSSGGSGGFGTFGDLLKQKLKK